MMKNNEEIIILPYGLEFDKNCIVDGIENVPKNIGDYDKIIVQSVDERLYYYAAYESETQAMECQIILGNRTLFITNPLKDMTIDDINRRMMECINEQPKEWKEEYKVLAKKRKVFAEKHGRTDEIGHIDEILNRMKTVKADIDIEK